MQTGCYFQRKSSKFGATNSLIWMLIVAVCLEDESKLYAMILENGRQIWDIIHDMLPDAVQAAQKTFVENPNKENKINFEQKLKDIDSSPTEAVEVLQKAKKKEQALKEEEMKVQVYGFF
ncbi:hypothetical protein DdX_10060 [Ditylenchus destructor]|uniref:Uncharacterized protein n=1 Tax=Ditylenchus destructor TaxID=166010 RepID=A0AAD4R5J1_9BILA|nr:hypothetical protein DdX_10060 [Ditylenchus destructor]